MSDHKVHFFEEKPQLSVEKNTGMDSGKTTKKLNCKNYGFECNFMTSEGEIDKIIEEFREHTKEEHYTDYPAGILKRSLL